MREQMQPDLTLMDAVHAMTFAPHMTGITHISTETRNVLRSYRIILRQAEKFAIDDDAVRLCCHLSHENDKLPNFAFLARLPFDVCWIEYDLQVKVSEFSHMNTLSSSYKPEEIFNRVGYLLYKDDPNSESPAWIATQFYANGKNILPGLLSFVFNPEGSDYEPTRGSKRWRSTTLSLLPGFPRLPVKAQVGGTLINADVEAEALITGDLKLDVEKGVIGNSWTNNRAAVFIDPFWASYLSEKAKKDRQNYYSIFATEVKEEMGHLRYLMTLLASINNLPQDIRPAITRVGKRAIGANMLPYFQHRAISIKLPRDDRVVWARRQFDKVLRNMPRAWHRVSGHWRIIEHGKTPIQFCRHMPTMVENGLGICERCELIIRWIPDHHRGDPNVGIIDHTYRVSSHPIPKNYADFQK